MVKFKPLNPLDDEFMNWYIKTRNIELCRLYHPPYNFKRTGCAGCPFSLDLNSQLKIMKKHLPHEYKKCNYFFGKVYDEYKRINYRIKKGITFKQINIFDILDEEKESDDKWKVLIDL